MNYARNKRNNFVFTLIFNFYLHFINIITLLYIISWAQNDTPRAPWWPSLLMDRHTHTRTPTTPPHPPGSHRHQQRHTPGARPPYKSHQDPGHLGQIHTQPNTGGGLVGLRRGPGAYLPGPPGGGAGEPQRLWRRVADERVGFWVKFELLFALIFRELWSRFGRVSTNGSVWMSECYD